MPAGAATGVSARVHTDVVVLGGSVAGLGTALALCRRGLGVTVIEADPATAGDAGAWLTEAARQAPRRATPQAAHSHAFLARARDLLAAEAPDVLDDLRAAGTREVVLGHHRPAGVPRHAPQPGDDRLVVLAARRTTFEAALRRAVRRRPEVAVVTGQRVIDLLAESGAVPRVRGVALEDGTVVTARLVVDATGRRTPVPGWLARHGVTVTEESVECGIAYLSRFYRRAPGAPVLPLDRGFTAGGSFDRYSCLVFPADAGAFSVTFGVLPEDKPLRRLLDPGAFDAGVRSLPALAPWIDADHAEPLSGVRLMAGLHNSIRRLDDRGRPAVTGFTAVGDAAATTNPAHSRGCALGLVHAVGVAEAAATHAEPGALAEACAAVVERDQAPWVADSIEQDGARLARWRPSGGGVGAPGVGRGRLTNGETYLAAHHDAYVWRRFTRLQQLLERPDDVLADPRVVARVRAVQAAAPARAAPEGPSHGELVDIAAGAAVP